jgi:hypothetical protein
LRTITALLVLAAAVAAGGQASASDIYLKKTTPEELKGLCAKAGGKFSQGPARYGCGTDCKGGTGTDCIVSCTPEGKCVAQVIGGRRPRTIEQALTKPARH